MSRVEIVLTGPGVEKKCEHGFPAALSAAITCASNAARGKREETFYVRDRKGNILGYATSEEGVVYVRDVRR